MRVRVCASAVGVGVCARVGDDAVLLVAMVAVMSEVIASADGPPRWPRRGGLRAVSQVCNSDQPPGASRLAIVPDAVWARRGPRQPENSRGRHPWLPQRGVCVHVSRGRLHLIHVCRHHPEGRAWIRVLPREPAIPDRCQKPGRAGRQHVFGRRADVPGHAHGRDRAARALCQRRRVPRRGPPHGPGHRRQPVGRAQRRRHRHSWRVQRGG